MTTVLWKNLFQRHCNSWNVVIAIYSYYVLSNHNILCSGWSCKFIRAADVELACHLALGARGIQVSSRKGRRFAGSGSSSTMRTSTEASSGGSSDSDDFINDRLITTALGDFEDGESEYSDNERLRDDGDFENDEMMDEEEFLEEELEATEFIMENLLPVVIQSEQSSNDNEHDHDGGNSDEPPARLNGRLRNNQFMDLLTTFVHQVATERQEHRRNRSSTGQPATRASLTTEEDEMCPDYHSEPFQVKPGIDSGSSYPADDLIVFLSTHDLYIYDPSGRRCILHIPALLSSASVCHRSSLYHNPSVAWQVDRLAILQWVPELSCLIVGTQAGFAIIVHLLRRPVDPVDAEVKGDEDGCDGTGSASSMLQIEAHLLSLPLSDAQVGPLAGLWCRKISTAFHQLFLLYLDGSTRVYNIYRRLDYY